MSVETEQIVGQTDANTVNETNGENNADEEVEQNNADNDSDLDLFRSLYGEPLNDEDDDDDDHLDYCYYDDANEQTEDTEVDANTDVGERPKQSTAKSSKRLSSDESSSMPKRIKTEKEWPTSAHLTDNMNDEDVSASAVTKKLTTRIEVSDSVDIPSNSQEFMLELLSWDSNGLDSKTINDIPMSSNLTDLSQLLRFADCQTYQETYIPYILVGLWTQVTQISARKHANRANSKTGGITRFLSILTKSKSQKLSNGLEMKCVFMRKAQNNSEFRFGQMVVIRTAVQLKPTSNAHTITRNSYFGYVVNQCVRAYNKENQSEVNHLRLISEIKRDSILVEEVTFLIKYADEVYKRNDALVLAEPLLCVHNYHLEARSLYKLNIDFPQISSQILNPIYVTKPSGILRDSDITKFSNRQLEVIQAALDVISCSSPSYSRFLAINGPNGCGKTATLMEIAAQIIRCREFADKKILFISPNENSSNNILQHFLRKLKINACQVTNENNSNENRNLIKFIINKLTKDSVKLVPQKKKLYEECLKYYQNNCESELSVEAVLMKNSIVDHMTNNFMKNSNIIIGNIDDLCNNISFYKMFANRVKENIFSCCIVDDAQHVTEAELCSLLWFGVNKFILAGNLSLNKRNGGFSLSNSFFKRYYSCRPEELSQFKTIFNFS